MTTWSVEATFLLEADTVAEARKKFGDYLGELGQPDNDERVRAIASTATVMIARELTGKRTELPAPT